MIQRKKLFNPCLSILIITFVFSSCGTHKKMLARKKNKQLADSVAVVTKNKSQADSIQSIPKIKKKDITKLETAPKAKVVPKTTTKLESHPLPPIVVESNFKNKYEKATSVSWNRNNEKNSSLENKPAIYIAKFEIAAEKFIVIYNEQGEIIETITQILPAQLPHNIHTAIQAKYPQHTVVSAKNSTGSASKYYYSLMVTAPNDLVEKQVFMSSDGKFIEK